MKDLKIYNVVQGTDEWKEIKWGKIGGSRAEKLTTKLGGDVMEVAEFFTLLAERVEEFDPFKDDYTSAKMQRGIELEQFARIEYERVTGKKVNQYGWIESDFCKNVGISTDGIIDGENKSIEIKSPDGSTHLKYLLNNDLLLEDYVWQITHNFLVLEVDEMDCISYRPENLIQPLLIVNVTKDTKIAISKKVTLTVAELVEIEKQRLLEVERMIETVINNLKTPSF